MSPDYFRRRYAVLDKGGEQKVLVYMFQIYQKYKLKKKTITMKFVRTIIVYELCIPFSLALVSMNNKMPEDPCIEDEEYFAVCADESLVVCRPLSDIFK